MSGSSTRRTRLGSTAPQTQQDEEKNDQRGEGSEDKGLCETQGKRPNKVKPKYICKGGKKVCGQVIDDDEGSVGCDLCGEWFHPMCQGLSLEAFNALNQYKHDFIWLCVHCKTNIKNVLRMGKRLESQIEAAEQNILGALKAVGPTPDKDSSKQLEDKIASMEEAVTVRLAEQQKEVEKSINVQKEVIQSMPEIQRELQKNTQELKKMIEKKEDGERREVNVIIHNIPESKSSDPALRKRYDENSFQNIVEALLGEDMKMETDKIYRLGKKREVDDVQHGELKPRLMLVGLKRKEDVEVLMKERWSLSKVGFSNIYITRDLSPEQREQQRKLREELASKGKDTHKIFRGKVIPRK